MGVEAFERAELRNGGDGFAERFFVEADETRASLKHVGGEAGEGFSGTAGWQRVARAGEEIAGGDGGPATEKEDRKAHV